MKTYQNNVDILGEKVKRSNDPNLTILSPKTCRFCRSFEVLRLQRHLDGGKAQRVGDVDVLVFHEDAATGPLKGVWRRKGVISSDGQRKDVRKPHFRSKGQH